MLKKNSIKICHRLILIILSLTSISATAQTNNSAILLQRNTEAPFEGVLIPPYQFRKIVSEKEQLALCESYLEKKDCGDNIYFKKNPLRDAALIGIGLALGSGLTYFLIH